jgi:hypothetical protein
MSARGFDGARMTGGIVAPAAPRRAARYRAAEIAADVAILAFFAACLFLWVGLPA